MKSALPVNSYLLITTEDPRSAASSLFQGTKVTVQLPSPRREENLACLLTGLYPGRLLGAGTDAIATHSFFSQEHLLRYPFFARLPEALHWALPQRAEPLSGRTLSSLPAGSVAWLHASELPPEELKHAVELTSGNTRSAVVPLGGSGKAFPAAAPAVFRQAPEDRKPAGSAALSLLDLLPLLFSAEEPAVPAYGALADRNRVIFFEDWKALRFGAASGSAVVEAFLTRYPVPAWLLRVTRRLCSLKSPAGTMLFDPCFRAEISAAERLTQVAGKGSGAQQKRLFAFLQNHLSRYRSDERQDVVNRLKDLGYL